MKSFFKMEANLRATSSKSTLKRHYSLDPQRTSMIIDLFNYHLAMTLEFASPTSFKLIAFLCYNLTNIDINETNFKSKVITANPIAVETMEDFTRAIDEIKVHNNLVKIMQMHDFTKRALTINDVFDYLHDLSISRKTSKEVFVSSQMIAHLKNKSIDSAVPNPNLYKIAFSEVNNQAEALGWTIQNTIMLSALSKSTDFFIVRNPKS